MNHEPRGPEMRPSGWRLRKACVGRLWRERKPNLSEPVKCSQCLADFRWCNVRSAVWQPAKCCEHFAGAVVRQAILVRHAIQSVDARRGGALEVKKAPAQCCERLAGHEDAMFQRVRLVGPIPRQCPITTATVSRGAYGLTRKSGGFAIWRPAMFRTELV